MHMYFIQNEDDPIPLFDSEILNDIDLSEGECSLHECGLSVENPGDNLVLRPLCTNDYDKGKFVSFAKQISGDHVIQASDLNYFNS